MGREEKLRPASSFLPHCFMQHIGWLDTLCCRTRGCGGLAAQCEATCMQCCGGLAAQCEPVSKKSQTGSMHCGYLTLLFVCLFFKIKCPGKIPKIQGIWELCPENQSFQVGKYELHVCAGLNV